MWQSFKSVSPEVKAAIIIGFCGVIAAIVAGIFQILPKNTSSNPPTPTPSFTSATAVQSSTVTPIPSPTSSTSALTKTLQTLCDATKAGDYQTQWNQFDPGFAMANWGSEQMYATDLTNRDSSHDGVANCTFKINSQNSAFASATTTTTFNDTATDINNFQLKEVDGVWKIYIIVGK